MKRKKATKEFVPKALRQVWEWKAASYREVAHLPTRDALRRAHEVAVAEGFVAEMPAKLAEAKAKYRAKR